MPTNIKSSRPKSFEGRPKTTTPETVTPKATISEATTQLSKTQVGRRWWGNKLKSLKITGYAKHLTREVEQALH